MPPVIPNPKKIRGFRSEAAFEAWLAKNHDRETELWLRIYKKATGRATVTYQQALDVALCWGWIDGLRKSHDDVSFVQRFTPRKSKSIWSQVNQGHVARLTKSGRMTAHGKRHVDAAKADGRWAAAYAPMREATHDTVPEDLRAAIEKNAKARATFKTLRKNNLFALAFRTNAMKTKDGRARKIAELVKMLAEGRTILPGPNPLK
jgi:uncharacterized protein YdeI (YjbR/CyaY-like superfamily)